MAAEAPAQNDPELQATAWDLEPLVEGEGTEGVERRMTEALTRARAFAERYAGRLAELDHEGLAAAMTELAEIYDQVGRGGYYAALRFSTDTADPANGALLQRVQEQETAIQTTLLFFELEWAALPQERAEELLAGEGLDFCRHHLRKVRRYRDHLLSEPEEKILAEKALTGASAWTRLFEELTSAIEVDLPETPGNGAEGGRVALDVALSRLSLPDREVRRTTAEAVTAALAPGLRTRGLPLQHAARRQGDRRPSSPLRHWLAARNLANEASDESVQALIEAVRGRYEIPRRWYRLKAGLLGVDRLADYDRMASVTEDEVTFPFAQAREIVLDCYHSFSPGARRLVVERFFDERRIDAPVRPAKRGGAFCASAVPEVFPYVLLNYTARRRDVLTLAHELGHGVHFALAARQGDLSPAHPADARRDRLGVRGDDRLRQAAGGGLLSCLAAGAAGGEPRGHDRDGLSPGRHEPLRGSRAHLRRAARESCRCERFGELWAESQEELFGDSIELTEGYRSWWSYIPHFIGSPGYVYAYAYGQLLALSVYERYEQEGRELVPRYLELLAAGGSRRPGGARQDRRHRPRRTPASGLPASISSSASSRRPRRPPGPPAGWSPWRHEAGPDRRRPAGAGGDSHSTSRRCPAHTRCTGWPQGGWSASPRSWGSSGSC